jgi:hypothetical protein
MECNSEPLKRGSDSSMYLENKKAINDSGYQSPVLCLNKA